MPLRLVGADNFRSLHGMPAANGRWVAGHTVLRSDHLVRLTEADWQTLHALGLQTVCDLRSSAERLRYPSRLPCTRIRDLHFNMVADVRADARFAEMMRDTPLQGDRERAVAMMLAVYRQLPHSLAPNLRALFDVLDRGEIPVLIHCTAGKDRTGFVVAVLLHALGAGLSTIVADYLQSRHTALASDPARRSRLAQSLHSVIGHCSEPMLDAVLGVQESYLQTALDEVARVWGSLDGYLIREAGMNRARLSLLRDLYLSDEPFKD